MCSVIGVAAARHGPDFTKYSTHHGSVVRLDIWLAFFKGSIAWYVAVVPTNSKFGVCITPDHDDIPPPRPYGPWPRPPPREAAVGKPLPRSPLREKLMGAGLPTRLANLQDSVHAIRWVLLPRKSSIWPI